MSFPEITDLTDYVGGEYRYLYCLSRLDGNAIRFGRDDSDRKMVIRQESHAISAPNDKDNDYLLSYTMRPIEQDFPNEILFEIAPNDFFWTHVAVYRTENVRAEDADLETVENTFLWVFDIPIVQFGVINYIRIWNDTAVFRINTRTMGEFTAGSKLFIRKSPTSVLSFTVIRVDGIIENTDEVVLFVTPDDLDYLELVAVGDWCFSSNSINNYIDIYYGTLSTTGDDAIEITLDGASPTFPTTANIYDNFLILWEDGTTSVVTEKTSATEAIIRHIDGAPEVIDPNPPDSNIRFVIIHRSSGVVGNQKIRFGDTVTDEVLKGRKESSEVLYFMQNRFFNPLPQGNLSAIKFGAYFCSSKEQNEYQYSQLSTIWRAGTYRPDLQKHVLDYGNVTRLKDYPDGVVVFGEHFTLFIDTSLTENVGLEDVGEFILQFQTPQLVTDEIGTPYSADPAELNKGEIIFTNQPSVRFFNGYTYAEDITFRSINKSILTKLKPFMISHWNPNRGYFLWGVKDEQA